MTASDDKELVRKVNTRSDHRLNSFVLLSEGVCANGVNETSVH